MAKLILNGSTSGSVTLESPAVSGTTTLTLPTTSGTVITTATGQTLTSPVIAGTPTGVGVLTSGTAVASTSGTSIDFTSIPSWVKRITVMFSGVSTSGTSNPIIQIGAGSVTTTGYLGAGMIASGASPAVSNFTTGFGYPAGASTNILHGTTVLTLVTGTTWAANGTIARSDGTSLASTAGTSASLSGALDRVRITTVNGTDTFDAGSVNILYE
jgi:hypothetical protein